MDLEPKPPIAEPPVMQFQEQELVAMHSIPFPPFVIILAAVSVIAFSIGLFRLPRAIKLGIGYSQAKKALENNQGQIAVDKLKPIIEAYPDSEDVRLVLYRASVVAGDVETAVQQMKFFEGKQVTKEENDQLNAIDALAEQKFKEFAK